MTTALRDYQQEMLTKLNEAWQEHRSVMVQMPTGTGKTHLMAAVIRERIAEGVLIVAHRRELLDQIRATVTAFGIDLKKEAIVVESIQKLARAGAHRGQTLCSPVAGAPYPQQGQSPCAPLSRQGRPPLTPPTLGGEIDSPGLVIIDEAHHALAKTYKMLWDWWPKAKFLGLTATPCRLSGESFTNLFSCMLLSWPIQTFIDKGWLSDFEYVSASPDSEALRRIASLDKRGSDGDYQQKQMATVMDVQESIEHLYNTYHKFTPGKKGIVYAINIEHAKHIAEYYQQQGERICEIDAKTPANERQQMVEDYKEGKIDILVSVDLFGEGYDCPEVEFIQLARPTLSLSKYLQQVGRGMRISKGKEAVTILDNVGLYQTFGLPTDDYDWSETFLGHLTGKGFAGRQMPIIIRDGENEKTLVNLDMIRIKRRKEKHEGIEVFLQGGKYGIMVDGQVTCQAQFVRIQRTNPPYFAVAEYPYEFFASRKTVIDQNGHDLNLRLFGDINTDNPYYISGETQNGLTQYWIPSYRISTDKKPRIIELFGKTLTIVKIGDKYYLPQLAKLFPFPLSRKDIYLAERFAIVGKYVVFGGNKRRTRKIQGFSWKGIILLSEKRPYAELDVLSPDGDSVVTIPFTPGLRISSDPKVIKDLKNID